MRDGAETGAGYLAEDQGGGDPGGEGLRDELVLQQLGGEGGVETNIKPIQAVE